MTFFLEATSRKNFN